MKEEGRKIGERDTTSACEYLVYVRLTVETIGSECGTGPVGATSPGEFESSSSSGEESSGLQHQERSVRVFNIRRGEFESSTSREESSSLQLH
jgi:hypothetical protein